MPVLTPTCSSLRAHNEQAMRIGTRHTETADRWFITAQILFGEEPNLVQLSMRLPDRYESLGRAIIQQLEMEATEQNPDKQ